MPSGWTRDEPPYAPDPADALANLLTLDGRGRLLDVGCGPGVLTLPLAPFVAEAVGVHLVAEVMAPPAARQPLPDPEPPYEAIRDLVEHWLGPVRRAGQGLPRHGTPGDEEAVLAAAGFVGPERLALPPGGPRIVGADGLVAWVWSLSSSAPHLFGDRLAAFEADLRRLLRAAAPAGVFAEWPADTGVRVWRKPAQGRLSDPGSAPA